MRGVRVPKEGYSTSDTGPIYKCAATKRRDSDAKSIQNRMAERSEIIYNRIRATRDSVGERQDSV